MTYTFTDEDTPPEGIGPAAVGRAVMPASPSTVATQRIPYPHPDALPKVSIGLNPFRWRRRVNGYSEAVAEWTYPSWRGILTKLPESIELTERAQIADAIRGAIRAVSLRSAPFGVMVFYWARFAQLLGVLSLFAPLVVVLVVAGPDVHGWSRFGAAMMAIAVYFAMSLLNYLLIAALPVLRGSGRPRAVIIAPPAVALGPAVTAVLFAVAVAGLAVVPPRLRHAPAWLATGWFHEALIGAAWVAAVGAAIGFVAQVVIRLYWARVLRRVKRQVPDAHFIDRTASFLSAAWGVRPDGVYALDTPDARLQYIEFVESIAGDFERDWPRSIRSSYPHAHQVARHWARQVAAATRSQQLPLLLGRPLPEVSDQLMDVLTRLILREPFEEKTDDDRSHLTGGFTRRLGRVALATLLLAVTAILVLMATWQPGLSNLMTEWHQSGLATLSRVPTELRPGVLGAAVAVFGLFVKVIAPQAAGEQSSKFS